MGEPIVEVVDLRVVIPKGQKARFFVALEDIHKKVFVLGFTELQNDGFGRLLPRGQAEVFVSEPQEQEVQRFLETGEVK